MGAPGLGQGSGGEDLRAERAVFEQDPSEQADGDLVTGPVDDVDRVPAPTTPGSMIRM